MAARRAVLAHGHNPEQLRELVLRDPADSRAWCWIIGESDRGRLAPYELWRAAGEHQLQRLAAQNPEDRVALWGALEAWQSNDRLAEGIQWADELVKRFPASINAWSAKGVLLGWAGEKWAARESFLRAFELTQSSRQPPADLRDSMLLNRAALLKRLGRFAEAQADYPSAWNTYPRDPGLLPKAIDLSGFYNATVDEAWYDTRASGNRNLTTPLSRVDGAEDPRFMSAGLVQLAGAAVTNAAAPFPEGVEGIPIATTCRRLNFAHGACGTADVGTVVGRYVVHFSDGAEEAITLEYGRHLGEWHPVVGREFVLSPGARGARGEPNPAGELTCLFLLHWENPRPEIPIASVDFVSPGASAAPFLVSITYE